MVDVAKGHRVPADQFERVLEEMRRFSNMLDEQERHIATARGITAIEARRCFAVSSTRLQEAKFWFQEALKYATANAVEVEVESKARGKHHAAKE